MDKLDHPETSGRSVRHRLLVFVGVGSVPATIIVNGDTPFTMADLGMISFAFATVVVATITLGASPATTASTLRSPSDSRPLAISRGRACRPTWPRGGRGDRRSRRHHRRAGDGRP